jgi:hypothetical protein
MINLLAETLEDLSVNGKSPADVKWVGREEFVGSWEDFAAIADFSYDNGFGGNEIDLALVVVGDDWWLERSEYDGLESWAFKTMPIRPDTSQPLTKESLLESYYVGKR